MWPVLLPKMLPWRLRVSPHLNSRPSANCYLDVSLVFAICCVREKEVYLLTFSCGIFKIACWTCTHNRCCLNSKWICCRLSEPIYNYFQKGFRHFRLACHYLKRVQYDVLCDDTMSKIFRYRLPFHLDTSTVQHRNKRQYRSLRRYCNMQKINLLLMKYK